MRVGGAGCPFSIIGQAGLTQIIGAFPEADWAHKSDALALVQRPIQSGPGALPWRFVGACSSLPLPDAAVRGRSLTHPAHQREKGSSGEGVPPRLQLWQTLAGERVRRGVKRLTDFSQNPGYKLTIPSFWRPPACNTGTKATTKRERSVRNSTCAGAWRR